jgi:hypothetical protein
MPEHDDGRPASVDRRLSTGETARRVHAAGCIVRFAPDHAGKHTLEQVRSSARRHYAPLAGCPA